MKSTFAVVPLLMLAACGETVAPYAALPIEDDAERVTNVVITDAELREQLRVGRPGVERIPTSNQLKVMVPIRNVGESTVQVRVQVSFLDLDKSPIGDDTNAQVRLISPGMTITHTALSTSDAARDWTMRIMPH